MKPSCKWKLEIGLPDAHSLRTVRKQEQIHYPDSWGSDYCAGWIYDQTRAIPSPPAFGSLQVSCRRDHWVTAPEIPPRSQDRIFCVMSDRSEDKPLANEYKHSVISLFFKKPKVFI